MTNWLRNVEEVFAVLDGAIPELPRLLDAAEGQALYVVGGTVRDLMLGRGRTDLDIAVEGDAAAIAHRLGGEVTEHGRFGTAKVKLPGSQIDLAATRAEIYPAPGALPEVRPAGIEEDLARRDFTVNAMALALDEPELVDPFGGIADLHAKQLRTPQAPEVSFEDDPLRMLRAARFVATLGFEPDAEVVRAIEAMHERLEIISAERIRDELSKMLLAEDPTPGLWMIARTGLSQHFLPELDAMELEQDPIHRHKDVLAHTIAVVAKTSPQLVLRLAALMHDVGKPRTRGIGPAGVTFHHHEVVGARMTRKRLTELRYSTDIVEAVTTLVELHLRFHTYRMGWTDSAVRRYVRDAGDLLDELNELTRCDCTTRDKRKADALGRRMDELVDRIAELREQEELAKIKPPLDGKQVMEFLGVGPGPVVGKALAFLLDLRLDEGPMTEDEARTRLAAWASDQEF